MLRVRLYVTSGGKGMRSAECEMRNIRSYIASFYFRNANRHCSEGLIEFALPIPFGPRATAVEVERCGSVLRVGVAGEVRFGEGDEACDAAFAREFMPDRIDRLKPEVRNDRVEHGPQRGLVAKPFSVATSRLNEPFRSYDHLAFLTSCTNVTSFCFDPF